MADELDKKEQAELSDDDLDGVGGGYVGSDEFTFDQYAEAGVSWEHNVWSKDKYVYQGVRVSQDEAEAITRVYRRVHGK